MSKGTSVESDDQRLRAAVESTVLGAAVALDAVDALCREAADHRFRAVCVPPAWVSRASRVLEGSGIRVVTVANFPFGHALPAALAAEARAARNEGADEVDVVFPLHCVPSRDWSRARSALNAFEEGLGELGHKVILETAAWTPDELEDLLSFIRSRGSPTVKTSTGFHPKGGASVAAVRTLRRALPEGVTIKASGGIRTRAFALELLDAGADFLGTSSALEILDG